MEEDGIVNIKLLYIYIKLLDFWNLLFPFKENMKKKSHNMLSLMLDTRFKTLCLGSSFIDHEQGKAIVKEYEIILLFPMLLSVIIICIIWLNLKG